MVARVSAGGRERRVVAGVERADEVEAALGRLGLVLRPHAPDQTGTGSCTGFVVNVMSGMS